MFLRDKNLIQRPNLPISFFFSFILPYFILFPVSFLYFLQIPEQFSILYIDYLLTICFELEPTC